MMDIEGIPPPPPEEFEGIQLPSADSVSWNNGPSGQPYGYGNSYNSGSSGHGDAGAAWQKAMDALNQSVAAQPPAYGTYPSSYPPPMPPPGWPPSSYAYPSSYPNSYQQQQQHNSQPMTVNHQYGQGYQNHAAQYGQGASQQSQYHQPPAQQPSYGAPRAPAPQNQYRSRPPRPSMSRYTYHPYPTGSTTQPAPSTETPVQQQQKLDTRTMPPPTMQAAAPSSFYSGYATAPSTSTGSGVSDHSVDMDIDEVTNTTPSSYGLPRKQAPGAGGIRFQLSKKPLSETKLSNPLLQKRFANAPPNHPPSSSFSASSYSHPPSSTPTNTQPDSFSGRSSSPPPASSPPKSQNSGLNIRSDDWPVSLQNYVAKAIAVTPPEKTSHVMQTITQMITNAYKTNTLHTCKWEKAPMPYADEASNELFGLSPKRENSPPTFRSSSGRGRGGRPALRRGRVSNRRSDSDESGDEKSSQVSSSSRARNGKSSSPRGGEFSGEDYLSLRKGGSSSSTKKGKKGTQTGPRGKLLGFGAEAPMTEEDQAKLRKRQERFGDISKTSSDSLSTTATPAIRSNSKLRKMKSPVASSSNPLRDRAKLAQRGKSGQRAVVGTCQTVEKEYFRLTEEAEPSLIRPLNILEQALDVVRDKWKREHNYRYAESQLKSIRQDLRVQHIFSPFTVKVYEMHARIALEVGDQAEFTQCLAQLEWLYDTLSAVHRKTGSSAGGVVPGCENRREFLSYRILYVMRQNRTTDMTRVRSQLSDEDKKDTCIAFAFSVLSAYFAGDYQQYFSLYKNAPMMAGYVMDVSTPIFRQKMLIKICAAYRPNLPVMALKEILCFSSEPELRDFLKAYRLTYTWMNGAEEIDCKASLAVAKAGPEILQPGEAQAQPQAPPPPKPKLVTSTPLRTSSKTRRRIAVSTA